MGAEPEILSASASVTDSDVDISLSGEMVFPNGAVGRIACSMAPGLKMENVLRIQGTDGSLEVINPLVPHFGYKMTLRQRPQHEDQQGDLKQDIRVTGKSTYHHQLDAVVELLSGQGTQITGGQDCVNNMRAIDSLYRAAGVSEFRRN
jgi:predicted dehydrogenase